jgi:transposase-like protein
MRRSEALQGVRVIKFRSILGRYETAELNQFEAAELLGIDERTFRRWRQRFEDDGEAGLLDRRLGKASGKRVPLDREHEVEALYRERYSGFTAKHFHEQLVARGATPGRRRFCIRKAFWRRRLAAGRIGASVRVGPCRGCCCIRTDRATFGFRACRRSI